MKFEFVEFYHIDNPKNKRTRKALGTCHVYAYSDEVQFDIRGIMVLKNPKGLWFLMPHRKDIDPETNQMVTYPVFSFGKKEMQQELVDFLTNEVTPIIRERLNPTKAKIA